MQGAPSGAFFMKKILFDKSPTSTTLMHTDGGENVVIEKVYDAEPALERAAYHRNEVQQKGELRLAMCIPAPLFYKLMQEGKLGEASMVNGSLVIAQATLDKLMRDPEISRLRAIDKL